MPNVPPFTLPFSPTPASMTPQDSSAGMADPIAPLGVEEYVEQAHFFGVLGERLRQNSPVQEVLSSVREETLATTKLPMAIDFLLAELRHAGVMGAAMTKLAHYFTPYQAYVVSEAENERGRFDLRIGLEILRREALYRAGRSSDGGAAALAPSREGLFLYQFESVCRNRLGYDTGLAAIAGDPSYDDAWRKWIMDLRRQVGMVDVADLVYVHSEFYRMRSRDADDGAAPPLFGEREGRIALANRRKDPMLLFASLHRQLGYPETPRTELPDEEEALLPQLARRCEQLEKRIKLLEEEQRGGVDLSKFYEKPPGAE
ncbi:hypothetical protein Mal64_22590 [Pseudobythopirellula maris]|uniref:Uncharacterized protein n=1 Tax=Pseudobythopirellula maris TaxID=2527991 RepID=A0A5C5ZPP9_9BACT|nr:hypothetical protein [Pseudobythopirellula maris]TWT88771.1 hypothetical protein Mal64_22590 [Pseudobythopirellula maris]